MKNIKYEVNENGIAEIIFDNRDEKVNVLKTTVMQELEEVLNILETNPKVKILLFKSAKEGIFNAGADINEILEIKTYEDAFNKSGEGQRIINRIENLPFLTAAVINGACLGGGLELALSCKIRIVTENKKVQLGLPETTLGIIPGFGGTYRLPKLIGIKESLNMILSGKTADGLKAYKLGLADYFFTEAFLEDKTNVLVEKLLKDKTKFVRKTKYSFFKLFFEYNFLGRSIIFNEARKEIFRKTRGFYPALLKAITTIKENYGKKLDKALLIERKHFSELAVTGVSKNLIDIFFINEQIKKAFPVKQVKKNIPDIKDSFIGVLGAGKMGGGISWLFSNSNIKARMKDISWNALLSGYKAINEIYNDLKKIRKIDDREKNLRMHKVTGSVDYSGFKKVDIVIEAIIEDKEVKIKTLKELENQVSPETIIATNTSSFSVEELSSELVHPLNWFILSAL